VGRQKSHAQLYFLFPLFLGAFAAEIIIMLFWTIKSLVIETSFWFLTGITFVALILFVKEGLAVYRKLNFKHTNKK
jgi:hypothetical protein